MTALAAAGRRASAVKPPARQQMELALAFLALVAVVCAMSLAGLGVLAQPFYMLAGAGFAWFAMRRSPWLYLTATLWFWLLTAFVRRFIEWRTGFNPTNIILATPNVMMLFMLKDILTAPGLLAKRELGPGLAVAAAISYGICVSFFRGDVVPGAVAAADWLSPLFYFFFIAAHSGEAGSLEPHFRAFLPLIMGVTVPYGFFQYFFMPDWDAQWMINSAMGSIGAPVPLEVRVFGTTNNPGFLAFWTGTCVLLAPFLRSKALNALVPAAAFLLILTLVRAAYGSVTIGLLAAVVLGRGQAFKPLLLGAVVLVTVFAGLTVVSPVVANRVTARFDSMQSLDSDDSALTRRRIYQETPDLMDRYPLGLGIGAIGRGAVASGGHEYVDVDSGPLAAYLALGWVGGTVYIFGLLLAAGQALAAARRLQSPLILGFACAALCPLATFVFINVNGFSGVLIWICLGCVTALSRRPRTAAPAVPAGSAQRADAVLRPTLTR